jgi:hypothetical protein
VCVLGPEPQEFAGTDGREQALYQRRAGRLSGRQRLSGRLRPPLGLGEFVPLPGQRPGRLLDVTGGL